MPAPSFGSNGTAGDGSLGEGGEEDAVIVCHCLSIRAEKHEAYSPGLWCRADSKFGTCLTILFDKAINLYS